MTKTITIQGLNKTVTIETDKVVPYTTDSGDEYEETAISSDGSLVAYDDACNMWVQLWPSCPDDYPNALKRVMLTQEPDGFGVCIVTDDSINLIWSGNLEDAIITAANTAEDVDAANVDAWREFESTRSGEDMDALSKELLDIKSAEMYRWAFDPSREI